MRCRSATVLNSYKNSPLHMQVLSFWKVACGHLSFNKSRGPCIVFDVGCKSCHLMLVLSSHATPVIYVQKDRVLCFAFKVGCKSCHLMVVFSSHASLVILKWARTDLVKLVRQTIKNEHVCLFCLFLFFDQQQNKNNNKLWYLVLSKKTQTCLINDQL